VTYRSTAAGAAAAIRFAIVVCCVIGAVATCSAQAATPACPTRAPATLSANNPRSAQSLVPSGARWLVLCRYHGLNPAALAGRLERSAAVTAHTTLTGVAAELNALPSQGNYVFHCPMDDGSEILAIFGYPSGTTDTVSIGLTGCQLVTNGRITRTASRPPGPALLATLGRLL
jgi:hypothetical protein